MPSTSMAGREVGCAPQRPGAPGGRRGRSSGSPAWTPRAANRRPDSPRSAGRPRRRAAAGPHWSSARHATHGVEIQSRPCTLRSHRARHYPHPPTGVKRADPLCVARRRRDRPRNHRRDRLGAIRAVECQPTEPASAIMGPNACERDRLQSRGRPDHALAPAISASGTILRTWDRDPQFRYRAVVLHARVRLAVETVRQRPGVRIAQPPTARKRRAMRCPVPAEGQPAGGPQLIRRRRAGCARNSRRGADYPASARASRRDRRWRGSTASAAPR